MTNNRIGVTCRRLMATLIVACIVTFSGQIAVPADCTTGCITSFGTPLGTNSGVIAFSNCKTDCFFGEGNTLDGRYMGEKWQCVEYARRYWYSRYGMLMGTLSGDANAFQIWNDIISVTRVSNNSTITVDRYANGSSTAPSVGDFLVYNSGVGGGTGHVAVIVAVNTSTLGAYVRLAEQNWNNTSWGSNSYDRELSMSVSAGSYTVSGSNIYGWKRIRGLSQVPFFAHTWGGANDEWISNTAVAGNGDIYALGTTSAGNSGTILLLRFDKTGTLIWSKSYDFGVKESAKSVTVASDGNLIISAWIETRFVDALLMKVDPDGNKIWAWTWGSDAWDPGGPHVTDAAGNTYQEVASTGGTGAIDGVLLKYDAGGNPVWARAWRLNINNSGFEIALDPSGNVYVSGFTGAWPWPGGQDIQLQKWDPDGNLLWDRLWVGAGTETGYALAMGNDGSAYVGGLTSSFGLGNDDCILLKFDAAGNPVWQRAWGGAGVDVIQSMWMASDGVIHAVGSTTSFGGSTDLLLLRYDADGNLLSQQVWATGNNEQANTIHGSPDGSYLIGGSGSNCSGAWSDVVGTEGVPSGTILSNQGTVVAPVGTVMPVTPTITNYPGTQCTGGGGSDALIIFTCKIKPGDANASNDYSLADIISTANYIFNRPNFPSCPSNSILCWLSDLLCRGDWNGSGTVTLSDVIQGVNYIFNKPGGPWNPIPSGPCCLPVP